MTPGPFIHIEPWGPSTRVDRFLGFTIPELIHLRRILDTYNWPMERALNILRLHAGDYERREAWRRHFGLLAEMELER
jgi:hypothetical protein